MNIAFYLSDHGFGHAARNIPIIHELLNPVDIEALLKSLDYKRDNFKKLSKRYTNCSFEIARKILESIT